METILDFVSIRRRRKTKKWDEFTRQSSSTRNCWNQSIVCRCCSPLFSSRRSRRSFIQSIEMMFHLDVHSLWVHRTSWRDLGPMCCAILWGNRCEHRSSLISTWLILEMLVSNCFDRDKGKECKNSAREWNYHLSSYFTKFSSILSAPSRRSSQRIPCWWSRFFSCCLSTFVLIFIPKRSWISPIFPVRWFLGMIVVSEQYSPDPEDLSFSLTECSRLQSEVRRWRIVSLESLDLTREWKKHELSVTIPLLVRRSSLELTQWTNQRNKEREREDRIGTMRNVLTVRSSFSLMKKICLCSSPKKRTNASSLLSSAWNLHWNVQQQPTMTHRMSVQTLKKTESSSFLEHQRGSSFLLLARSLVRIETFAFVAHSIFLSGECHRSSKIQFSLDRFVWTFTVGIWSQSLSLFCIHWKIWSNTALGQLSTTNRWLKAIFSPIPVTFEAFCRWLRWWLNWKQDARRKRSMELEKSN